MVTEGDAVVVRVWVGLDAAATFVAAMVESVPGGTLDAGIAAVQPSTVKQIAETIPRRTPCLSFRCNCMHPIITSKPSLVNSPTAHLRCTQGNTPAVSRRDDAPTCLQSLTFAIECATIAAGKIELDAHPEGWRDRPYETPATGEPLDVGRPAWCQLRQDAAAHSRRATPPER
jgi:hypothetical protein